MNIWWLIETGVQSIMNLAIDSTNSLSNSPLTRLAITFVKRWIIDNENQYRIFSNQIVLICKKKNSISSIWILLSLSIAHKLVVVLDQIKIRDSNCSTWSHCIRYSLSINWIGPNLNLSFSLISLICMCVIHLKRIGLFIPDDDGYTDCKKMVIVVWNTNNHSHRWKIQERKRNECFAVVSVSVCLTVCVCVCVCVCVVDMNIF